MKTRLGLGLILITVLLIPGVITLADDSPSPPDVPRLTITWDQTNSVPSFSGGAWSAFPADQAQVAKGGLIVAYSGPLSAASVPTVTLRPGNAPAPAINCTALPAPAARLPDECYYQVIGNQVRIYYMGNLAVGEDAKYTVTGLTALIGAAGPVDNVDSSTTGVPMAPGAPSRDPAAMVLVLDKSGSMNWSPNPFAPGCTNFVTVTDADPCGPPRWTILKRAVSAVLDVAEPYAVTGDEFAVSIFDSTVSFSSGFDPINSVTIGALEGQLNILAPGGATSIGAGLEQFTTFDGNNRNQVMVFSDGDQNTAPFVVSNGVDVVINPTTNSPIGPGVHTYVPSPAGVSLCPFAMRADDPASPTDTEYMQAIADLRCDGNNIFAFGIAPSSPVLVQYFLQFLNDTLFGDKLELAAVNSGVVTAEGDTPTGTETFTVENDVLAFTVLLTWVEPNSRVGKFRLEKDGMTFDNTSPNLIAELGDGHLAVTLREPFCDVEANCADVGGEWTFSFEPAFRQTETFTYNVFVNVDNRSLASEYSVTQAAPGVGEPLILEVVLTEADAPMEGLADGSVKAIVARPDAGLGNVLSAADIAPLQGGQPDPMSAAALKAWAMLGDPTLRDTLLAALDAQTIQELTLTEEEPGIYRASFTDVAVEGVYKVAFVVEAEAPQNGAFTRVYSIDRYVRVVPDPAATTLTVTQIVEGCSFANGCFAIVVKPMDKLGNLLGPGKGSLFTLPDFKGTLLADTEDHLDGSYTIRIGYPEGVTDKPTLDIFGTTITVEDVNPEPREDEDGGIVDQLQDNPIWLCLILLVILLVLVLLFWLLRRRRSTAA